MQDYETAEVDLEYHPGKQMFQLQGNLYPGRKAGSQYWNGNGLSSGKGTGEDWSPQQRDCLQIARETDKIYQ